MFIVCEAETEDIVVDKTAVLISAPSIVTVADPDIAQGLANDDDA